LTQNEIEELKNRLDILNSQKQEQDFGGTNTLYLTTQEEKIKNL
jgi:hypothetical protein